MKTACRIATGFHALLCGAALLMVPLNAEGMAGEPDPLGRHFCHIDGDTMDLAGGPDNKQYLS